MYVYNLHPAMPRNLSSTFRAHIAYFELHALLLSLFVLLSCCHKASTRPVGPGDRHDGTFPYLDEKETSSPAHPGFQWQDQAFNGWSPTPWNEASSSSHTPTEEHNVQNTLLPGRTLWTPQDLHHTPHRLELHTSISAPTIAVPPSLIVPSSNNHQPPAWNLPSDGISHAGQDPSPVADLTTLDGARSITPPSSHLDPMFAHPSPSIRAPPPSHYQYPGHVARPNSMAWYRSFPFELGTFSPRPPLTGYSFVAHEFPVSDHEPSTLHVPPSFVVPPSNLLSFPEQFSPSNERTSYPSLSYDLGAFSPSPPSPGHGVVEHGLPVNGPVIKVPESLPSVEQLLESRIPESQEINPEGQPNEASDSQYLAAANKPISVWEESLRRALGRPDLDFFNLDKRELDISQLFIAQRTSAPADHHPTSLASMEAYRSHSRGTSHFIRSLLKIQKVSLKSLDVGIPQHRVYVYLNSRSNMQYINDRYFLGRLQFLPINTDLLDWTLLNKMLIAHTRLGVLPPADDGKLPVVMARHDAGSKFMQKIQTVTGKLGDEQQIVSLWSPVMQEVRRRTIVFYGLGQLNSEISISVVDHLHAMAESWSGEQYKADVDLGKYAHTAH